MSDHGRMNLEELKKSFPSLDDHATKKLLGGWVDPDYEAPSDPTSPPDMGSGSPGGPPSTGSPSGGVITAGGGDYFGDSDWGNDSWGDGGWGDSGWGGDSWNDSSSNGNEGPNGENDQDTQWPPLPPQRGPQIEGHNQSNQNITRPYTLRNDSSYPIAYLIENTGTHQILQPGQSTNQPIEGFNYLGNVYKVTDGYNWVRVTDTGYWTNYPVTTPAIIPFMPSWGRQLEEGGFQELPIQGETWWYNLFRYYPPDEPLPWPPPFSPFSTE